MFIHSLLKLMRSNFLSPQGLRVSRIVNTANERNAAMTKIWRTSGEATLADFFVAPRSSMVYTSLVASRNLLKVASSVMKANG